MYRTRQPDAVIRRYLRAARRHEMLLVLDIQPGRSDFFTEATRLERWLREPDVGLALDPEWRVSGGEVPGQVIGHVDAREVNATSAWLAQLVARHDLPEKLFIVHQFTDDMVDDTQLQRARRAGDGAQRRRLRHAAGEDLQVPRVHAAPRATFDQGFKLFYRGGRRADAARADVLALRPAPDVVVYE